MAIEGNRLANQIGRYPGWAHVTPLFALFIIDGHSSETIYQFWCIIWSNAIWRAFGAQVTNVNYDHYNRPTIGEHAFNCILGQCVCVCDVSGDAREQSRGHKAIVVQSGPLVQLMYNYGTITQSFCCVPSDPW